MSTKDIIQVDKNCSQEKRSWMSGCGYGGGGWGRKERASRRKLFSWKVNIYGEVLFGNYNSQVWHKIHQEWEKNNLIEGHFQIQRFPKLALKPIWASQWTTKLYSEPGFYTI